jgi:SNF2 family DNA or RNA helicase
MPHLRQLISAKSAPISPPVILIDDTLSLGTPFLAEISLPTAPQILSKNSLGLGQAKAFEARLLTNYPTIIDFSNEVVFKAPYETTTDISGNQFSILESAGVFGMSYQSRLWLEIKSKRENSQQRSLKGTRPFTKSYLGLEQNIVANKSKPKAPSFWDLVYVLLQPPLVLQETENYYFPHILYDFQKAGVNFLMENASALLADEMGTGKTVQTVVALRLLIQQTRIRRALIICPLAVLRQWDEHLSEWAPDLLVTVVRGNQQTRTTDWAMPAHVYIVTYDTLRKDIENATLSRESLDKFDVVVLDEAQYIKNSTSSRAKAIKRLNARQRWALTGTPVENRIEDLVSIFEYLRPGYLSPFDLYPERIHEKIKPFFLRRRKEDVIQDLPPKIKQEIWLTLDAQQRRAYEQTLQNSCLELSMLGRKVNKTDIFRALNRLKQICNFAPGTCDSPKLRTLLEHVEAIVASNHKVIVFSQYLSEGIEKLERALSPYGLAKVIGGQSDRDFQVRRFQESKDVPILLASVRAGGVGLNLQAASYVIHFDHWWNPAVMWQAEARAHRKGQKRPVNVYAYWMSNTIEERIHQVLQSKMLLFEDIVGGMSVRDFEEIISTEEWLDIFGIKYKETISPKTESRASNRSLTDIHRRMLELTPTEFETVTKELLRCLGYPNTKVVGRAGDGGIDVISTRNTSDGVLRVIAQCKRYKGTVGVEVARELFGVICADKSIEKGFLVTTGEITRECAAFCERSGVIVSINGLQVANYIRQFGIPL